MIYFDYNATSPLLPIAREAWLNASDTFVGNPSSPHRLGARADRALSTAREQLAAVLGGQCESFELTWTSGATESNNTVFCHAARTHGPEAEVWISAIEHPCTIEAARRYFPQRVFFIPVFSNGQMDIGWIEKELSRHRPALIAGMAANNESGVTQPWQALLDICRQFQILFFCDAVQWLGKLPALGLGVADFVSGSAHKFGGPKGVGFLKWPKHGAPQPLLVGGAQEESRRAGTENVAGVLSMMAALQARENSMTDPEALAHRRGWQTEFERNMLRRVIGSRVVGSSTDRLWNTVMALMPTAENCQQRWVVKLDKLGFAVSTGSACASGKEEPSMVLRAMGYSADEASRVLRMSSGWETTEEDWRKLLEALQQVNAGLESRSL